ncbi:MAG: efflux RND transporter permease subunit [Lysobacteraceae bacterium]
MIERVIEGSVRHRAWVLLVVVFLVAWALDSMRRTPLDAIPDLSDPQVIVFAEWMGRSPDLVEDQITYPIVRALQSTPGVRDVRGYSMFGMSFVYAIFDDRTDPYWARTRVVEQLGRAQAQLPPDVVPTLGPDASGVGWIYQYVLLDHSGRLDLADLRALQDYVVRPALQAVQGVSEVAGIGGFERQYQVVIDPIRLAAYDLTPGEVASALRNANAEVGARVVEEGGREFVLRGRGYVGSLEDLESALVRRGPGGAPITVGDVAQVRFGPEIRRGAADLDGRGEVVGGIVVMRLGANALQVIRGVEAQIQTIALPEGVELLTTYDRSQLIEGSIATLRDTLLKETAIIIIVSLVFLMHVRSALVAVVILPVSVLMSFIGIRYLGLTSNIMSLGGIAIALVELADAVIVMVENAHRRLVAAGRNADRRQVIVDACKEVGRPIFFSTVLLTVSFLPVFALGGQAGRLFDPLAWTKTFAMLSASVLTITLAPVLMVWLLRGRLRDEHENPVARLLNSAYEPLVRRIVRHRHIVIGAAVAVVVATVPVYRSLGSEFMPPLDEGSLLVMPTTFPGVSIEQARQVLTAQHRVLREQFPEVVSVHGKAGRAETATDPAQLDMNESVVALAPRAQWPKRPLPRWHTNVVPSALAPMARRIWPEERAYQTDELAAAIGQALSVPGYQMAIAPPIRTRIDMLTTGVRTPVGIKVFGDDLQGIEEVSIALEVLLRDVPGTRSTFAERQSGREYIDIVPDRVALARHGLSMAEVHDLLELAVGGMPVSTVIDGRARYTINLRYGAGFRGDVDALRALPVPVPATDPVPGALGGGGAAPSSTASGAQSSAGGGAGGAGGMGGMTMGGDAVGGSGGRSAPSSVGMGMGGSEPINFAPVTATVPLGALAAIHVATGPPMIKNENGQLVGYLFADIDAGQRDLGGWVRDAQRLVETEFTVPAGYRLEWTGQYAFMADMQKRLLLVIPLTLLLIVGLLYLALRSWAQTLLVLLSVPFSVLGSFWLLAALGYNMSTATWVGVIAVAGVAAQTAIVVIVYLDGAMRERVRAGAPSAEAIDEAVVVGALRGVRPMVMTVATTVLGLLPLLWTAGVGADLSARTAAPVVGGMLSALVLTLGVLPAAYAIWQRAHWRAQARSGA